MEEIEYINYVCSLDGKPLLLGEDHGININCRPMSIGSIEVLKHGMSRYTSEKLIQLTDGLVKGGGQLVFVPYFISDMDEEVDKLLSRGQFWSGKDCKFNKGCKNASHINSSHLWEANQDNLYLVSGYALRDEGLWERHAWCVEVVDGNPPKIVETDVPRELYFGVVLTLEETKKFGYENTWFRLKVDAKTKKRYGVTPQKLGKKI